MKKFRTLEKIPCNNNTPNEQLTGAKHGSSHFKHLKHIAHCNPMRYYYLYLAKKNKS